MSSKNKKMIAETMLLAPVIALFYYCTENIVEFNGSEGKSMEPTLKDNSTIVIDKIFYKFTGLQHNDIIIAKSPVKPDLTICKRVKKLENEEQDGIKIPKNHIWIEGDNKSHSFDSRDHGPLPTHLVKGRLFMSFYPFRLYPNY
ncbi:Peptidase S24/S26A/S26B/S26C [Pseudocohnilembus persalinus]|uniref:Peptidase S24/S26A/S26B/S26C n=1 Tax=Pseudocohnilembus persalinus TaxID=266149 RepID=A0A0V0R232_PSEPJ|nr:Peptidase S24/S26A/S26B/S26C [Pseudocohnilembus persalinus]|eukprot:KRX08575.1 Peptidase S24/S26A/S26B/S26C [Pseudocohnilembus persalinus]